MKSIRKLMALASFLTLGLSACSPLLKTIELEEGDNAVYENDQNKLIRDLDHPDFVLNADEEEEETNYPTKVVIHFINKSESVAGKAFYVWADGVNGKEYNPDTVTDSNHEMILTLDFSTENFAGFANKDRMYFIIKNKKTPTDDNWAGQSEDTTLQYKEFPPNASGTTEVFCIPGEGNAIEVYESKEATNADRFLALAFKDFKTLSVRCSAKPATYELYGYTKGYYEYTDRDQTKKKPDYMLASGTNPSGTTNADGTFTFEIKLNLTAKINLRYMLEGTFPKDPNRVMQKLATFENLYTTSRFKQYYQYDGELGAIYSAEQTTFRVWAPTAYRMRLMLYKTGTPKALGGSDVVAGYDMLFRPGGIWEVTIKGDLNGRYYTYEVYNSLGSAQVVDPYAKACGVNGVRGEVLDFSKTNPAGWENIPLKWDGVAGYDVQSSNELSVYEVHIRDLTMDNTWTGKAKRGTYAAFSESGTKYTSGNKTVTTGFDHVSGLGIKAVQLIPIYDQDNDEVEMSFNWGYNPLNYNCLEGGYATDPFNGASRVQEFKNLVKAFANNEQHTRIIMDVVYNHVSSAPASNFNKLMPRYYFRYTKDWAYYNGSGCGNEVKTEAPMMSKFIVESLVWWAKEYKIKGFRFDLMGLIDCATLKAAAKKLYALDPDIVMYGEGWRGDGDGFHGEGIPAETGNVYSQLYATSDSIAVGGFNDAGRNALRGGNDGGWGSENALPGWGYMQQGAGDASEENRGKVADMLWGIHTGAGGNPIQCVNYASCHDNWTVFDQFYYTLGSGAAPQTKVVCDASLAAHSFVMASNGIAFMQGGEEIFRTKELDAAAREQVTASTYENMYGRYVSHNSYNAPDSVNSFKWDRKISIGSVDTSGYYDYFKGAIKLHSLMKKYTYPLNMETTTAGNPIEGISWAGKDKDNNTYNGGAGFQLDEYFVFLAGRTWAYVGFGDVPVCQKLFSTGTTSYDTTNKTVNLGNFDANTGGSIIVFYRGKKM